MSNTEIESETYDPRVFYDQLVAHKLILPGTTPGIFGRGQVFEQVLAAFNDLVTRIARVDQCEQMLFPPCVDRKLIEKVDYMKAFPHLAGTVFSFCGHDAQHRDLMERLENGQPWDRLLTMSDIALTPAVCYPCYAHLSGTLPPQGRLVDLLGWVYRHEPSHEPTRMVSFRMREFVRAADPDTVIAWRDLWLERGLQLMIDLGLPAKADVATDPFFGRGGKMMVANQRDAKLKFEVLVPVISKENPTAICSFNYHQDKFGSTFDIRTSTGEIAQTACMAFGMERVVMALFRTHGFDPETWPQPVRKLLFH